MTAMTKGISKLDHINFFIERFAEIKALEVLAEKAREEVPKTVLQFLAEALPSTSAIRGQKHMKDSEVHHEVDDGHIWWSADDISWQNGNEPEGNYFFITINNFSSLESGEPPVFLGVDVYCVNKRQERDHRARLNKALARKAGDLQRRKVELERNLKDWGAAPAVLDISSLLRLDELTRPDEMLAAVVARVSFFTKLIYPLVPRRA